MKLNREVRLKCKSVSVAREKVETIASLRLLDDNPVNLFIYNNLMAVNTETEKKIQP